MITVTDIGSKVSLKPKKEVEYIFKLHCGMMGNKVI